MIIWRGRMGETVNTHTHTHARAHKHTQTQIYTYTYRGFREIAGTEKRFSSQEWCWTIHALLCRWNSGPRPAGEFFFSFSVLLFFLFFFIYDYAILCISTFSSPFLFFFYFFFFHCATIVPVANCASGTVIDKKERSRKRTREESAYAKNGIIVDKKRK